MILEATWSPACPIMPTSPREGPTGELLWERVSYEIGVCWLLPNEMAKSRFCCPRLGSVRREPQILTAKKRRGEKKSGSAWCVSTAGSCGLLVCEYPSRSFIRQKRPSCRTPAQIASVYSLSDTTYKQVNTKPLRNVTQTSVINKVWLAQSPVEQVLPCFHMPSHTGLDDMVLYTSRAVPSLRIHPNACTWPPSPRK